MQQHLVTRDSGGALSNRASDDRPTVLVTTVDIGGGRSDRIEIRQGDDPADAARRFCELHQLPSAVLGPLTQHLLDNLRKSSSKPPPEPPMEPPALAPQLPAADRTSPDSSSLLQPVPEADSPKLGAQSKPSPAVPSSDASLSNTPRQPDFGPEPVTVPSYHQQSMGAAQHHSGSMAPSQGQAHSQGLAQSGGRPQGAPLSFAQPDDWLMQQLSAKLVPVDSKMLTVSSDDSKGSYHRGARRGSQSADPSPRDSVHFRLYNKAVDQQKRAEARRQLQSVEVSASLNASKTRMSWISAEMMRGRTPGPFDNYGEMLYAEGLESAAVRRSKAEAAKMEQSSRELQGVTFSPEITALAKALCGGGDGEGVPAWQRLSNQKKVKTMERLQEMKSMREQAEVKECTFKPQIDSRSRALMAERAEMLRTLQMSAHEQLFQDAIRRQQKMEELANWVPDEVTFKPQVNKSSMAQEYLRRSYEDPRDAGSADRGSALDGMSFQGEEEVPAVVQRLYARHAKTQAKLEAVRAKYTGPVDPDTGLPLYKPKVGRAPRNTARPSSSDPQAVYDQLYANALELQSKRQAAEQAEVRHAEAEANAAHATSTSQRLFDRLKGKRFAQIFAYLDAEQAGLIDLVALVRAPGPRVEELDPEVREDVELAAELHAHHHASMQQQGGGQAGADDKGRRSDDGAEAPPVVLEQFEALMEAALKLRRGPRSYLVPSPSGKAQAAPSFRPAINARSREMAARLRPPEADTYEILHGTAGVVRAKLEASRKAAEDEALRECTFVPLLNANSLAAEGKALRAAWQASYSGAPTSGGSTPRSSIADVSGGAGDTPTRPGANRPASARQSVSRTSATSVPVRRPASGAQAPAGPGFGVGRGAVGPGAHGQQLGGQPQDAADVAKLLALEQEVRAALQTVSLTTEQLDALGHAAMGAQHAPGARGAGGQPVAPAYPASAGIPTVDAADLRATEAMLLDLLGPQAAAEDSFQQKLAAALGVAAPPAMGSMAAAGYSSTPSYTKPSELGAAQQAVNMYVVPDTQASHGHAPGEGGSRLEDLARELNC